MMTARRDVTGMMVWKRGESSLNGRHFQLFSGLWIIRIQKDMCVVTVNTCLLGCTSK